MALLRFSCLSHPISLQKIILQKIIEKEAKTPNRYPKKSAYKCWDILFTFALFLALKSLNPPNFFSLST